MAVGFASGAGGDGEDSEEVGSWFDIVETEDLRTSGGVVETSNSSLLLNNLGRAASLLKDFSKFVSCVCDLFIIFIVSGDGVEAVYYLARNTTGSVVGRVRTWYVFIMESASTEELEGEREMLSLNETEVSNYTAGLKQEELDQSEAGGKMEQVHNVSLEVGLVDLGQENVTDFNRSGEGEEGFDYTRVDGDSEEFYDYSTEVDGSSEEFHDFSTEIDGSGEEENYGVEPEVAGSEETEQGENQTDYRTGCVGPARLSILEVRPGTGAGGNVQH